jgi:geranyl-CoA carboxylase alpha subunit
MSFDTLLIANRGEIACRVIASARAVGLRTVAVYSDADADARHTDLADEAVHIGAPPAAESYLDIEKILAAAKATGAGAIHPGYGFLSENPDFARACKEAGVVFVGPPAEAIEAMADKAKAKARMLMLVKAVAGGGGRGMRAVHSADELQAAITSARNEAKAGFGNDTLMLERLVTSARHVELQVFADAHGNVIHLGERDCSMQRRHQKVIEEAPSPAVDPELRAKMGAAAVAAAKAIGYQGAGTVEFLLGDNGEFFFLEMNTRLQVEHPVTEMITGLDLVEMQLRAAAGEELGLTQEDIKLDGHAIEVRLYAEDAYGGFMPQTGPVVAWEPSQLPDVRVDHGLQEGQEITAHYDPMIAKVIAWGNDRAEAIQKLQSGLRDTCILGPTHNKRFLDEMLGHEVMAAGGVTTNWLDELAANDLSAPEPASWAPVAACLLWLEAHGAAETGNTWSNVAPRVSHLRLESGDTLHSFKFTPAGDDWAVTVDDAEEAQSIRLIGTDGARTRLLLGNQRVEVFAALAHGVEGDTLHLEVEGQSSSWTLHDEVQGQASSADADGKIVSPASGKVLEVAVEAGQAVEVGDLLCKLESMKIESSILAPVAGTVAEVRTAANEQVSQGQVLVLIDVPESPES